MKKRISRYWVLSGTVGLAVVMAAVLLLVTMTAGKTPTASAAYVCSVTLVKTADPDTTVAPGQQITYTIVATVTGADCEFVTVSDAVPTGTSFVSASGGGTYDSGTGKVTWPDIITTGTFTFTLTVRVSDQPPSTISNTASQVGGDEESPATSNTVTLNVGACDLQISKEANRDEVDWDRECSADEGKWNDWDGNLDYDITVTNTGSACTNPVITDNLQSDGDILGCDDASVVQVSNWAGVTCEVYACTDSLAEWKCSGVLVQNGEIDLRLDAGLENEWADHNWDDEDNIDNTACVANSGAQETANSACASESVEVRHERHCEATATPTPTAQPTATPQTPIVIIVQPPPQATPQGTLTAPKTGTGSQGGSSPWLPVGLGLGGMCLLLVSGAALAKKRIR